MSIKRAPEYLQQKIQNFSEKSGVYLFKDQEGVPVYIGKALCLKKRVASHFHHYGQMNSKEGMMLSLVKQIDYIETPSEAEALLLEASLVKEMLPKYNKMLRDDKSYPFLKITQETWPRLLVVHGRKADGGSYYGPYTSVRLLKQAVKMLRKEFPLRTCKTMPKRVCLAYHIGLCAGPCEGIQSSESYMETVKSLKRFLEGRPDALVKSLFKRMKEYSENQEYEKAKSMYETARALESMSSVTKVKQPKNLLLAEFEKIFSLPKPPNRIECFDISNIQGKEAVGSMVVFVEGAPKRMDYRRFRIKTVQGIDDYKMMKEVVNRRYHRLQQENAPFPDLVLIDGGKGHLAAAKEILDSLGLSDLPIMSIAKQHEILFSPNRENPYVLPASSEVLKLIRHIRDEAHRFAITYHRHLHKKEALVSILDDIAGLGEVTKKNLLKNMGSMSKLKSATVDELIQKGKVRPEIAQKIYEAAHPTTGEKK